MTKNFTDGFNLKELYRKTFRWHSNIFGPIAKVRTKGLLLQSFVTSQNHKQLLLFTIYCLLEMNIISAYRLINSFLSRERFMLVLAVVVILRIFFNEKIKWQASILRSDLTIWKKLKDWSPNLGHFSFLEYCILSKHATVN